MLKITLLSTILLFTFNYAYSQNYLQFFDGNDTLTSNSLIISLDTSSSNIWQIGPPQKTIFDSAASMPNVIVTDTINTYPDSNKSVFHASVSGFVYWGLGISAIRWKQKLDMEFKKDGGYIEFSVDSGATWTNVFRDTNVYNFYGYDSANVDTLADGTVAFTGTDTTWRDIWLCYQSTTFQTHGIILFRFTFESDSVDANNEGWMIDNMLFQQTRFHTVNTVDPNKKILVYPTITNGIVKVATPDSKTKIENIVVVDINGRISKRYNNLQDQTTINISDLSAGNYFVHIATENKIEVHQITLNH